MENLVASKKWSSIKNLAAVTIDTGKKVGTVEDFFVDAESHAILGFEIKTSLFGHRVLPTAAINGIGEDALTFSGEEALIKEADAPALDKALRGHDLFSYRILSEGGTVVGTLGNILFTITLPQVQLSEYELAGGLRERLSNHYPTFPAQQVTRYGQDVLVIPERCGTRTC